MPTYTSKGLIKPVVDNAIDEDLWGTQLNLNSDKLETLLNNTTASKTADFSVATTEFNYTYLIDASGAAVTATLPEASTVYNGFVVRFKAIDVTNTITIDGYSSETIDGETTVTIDAVNDVIELVCDGTNWQGLVRFGQIPTGGLLYFAMSTAPTGWLECDGSAISRTTYARLFSAIGTTYGVGDGTTTFNIPQGQSEFLRGWDNGRGIDSGRVFGSYQDDSLEAHTHTVSGQDGNLPKAYGSASSPDTGWHNGTTTSSSTGGSETRPRNLAVLLCIKT